MRILAVESGSFSLKAALVDVSGGEPVASAPGQRIGTPAVGHCVFHRVSASRPHPSTSVSP
jgi:hypothetical protein